MAALQGEQDIKQLLLIAESYLGHSLSPTEMSSILYYYDSLHFNFELIEYLIEYCISRGTKSLDRKSTRLNSSHRSQSRMPSSA